MISEQQKAMQLYWFNSINMVQETNLGLDMNGTHQVLAYVDGINLIGDDIRTIERNAKF